MRLLTENGFPQRTAAGSDTATVTSDAALEAAEGSNVHAPHVVGLMRVGTQHHPDEDVTSEPRIRWRLTWVVASAPHDAPPPIAPPIDAPPETGAPGRMPGKMPGKVQSLALVDAHSGEVWGWLGL